MRHEERHYEEIYVSTDIETNGPVVGVHAMLSFASAAYYTDKTLVSTFSANLEIPDTSLANPQTMKWWQTQPVAWAAHRTNLVKPVEAMVKYFEWVRSLPGKQIFVASPAVFDFPFVYSYLMRFVGENPFYQGDVPRAIDINTYAMALRDALYSESSKSDLPKEWFDDLPHTHIALDDAVEHGALFCNMLKINRERLG